MIVNACFERTKYSLKRWTVNRNSTRAFVRAIVILFATPNPFSYEIKYVEPITFIRTLSKPPGAMFLLVIVPACTQCNLTSAHGEQWAYARSSSCKTCGCHRLSNTVTSNDMTIFFTFLLNAQTDKWYSFFLHWVTICLFYKWK